MIHRVLVVGPVLPTGGVARFIKALLGAEIGYELRLFNTARPAKANTAHGAIGYQTMFAAGFGWALKNAWITGWNLIRFPFALLHSGAGVVHIATSGHWSFWESAIYLLISRLLRRKVVFHYLSDFQKFYGVAGASERKWIEWVLRSADQVIVLSESVRQTVAMFTRPGSLVVVPSSVDVLEQPAVGQDPGSSLERPISRPTILFMGGTCGIRKGVQDLVSVVPRVQAEYRQVEFALCGGGDVAQACQSIAPEASSAVKYYGLVDEVTKRRLLAEASLYVLPSYSEGMPYSIIEAMACGLPVVTTNIGSLPEVVVQEENGLLITPGDTEALATALLRLLRDQSLAKRMSRANREKIAQQFSSDSAFTIVRQTYHNMTGIAS